MGSRKDFVLVTVIGALVGVLAQPILANFVGRLHEIMPVPYGVVRAGVLLGLTLFAPFALWVASTIGRKIPVLYQFAKFAAVGTLNSFVDLGVFNLETLLYNAVPTGFGFAAFKAISFLSATTNSFIWNKYWTFGVKTAPQAGEVAKFYAIAIAGGFLNVGVATLVFQAGPESNLWLNIVSPLSGIFATLLWNFIGYKFFVFKKTSA